MARRGRYIPTRTAIKGNSSLNRDGRRDLEIVDPPLDAVGGIVNWHFIDCKQKMAFEVFFLVVASG